MQLEQPRLPRILSLIFVSVIALPLWADEEPESASDEKSKTVKLSGVFESIDANQIKADTKHLSSLEIKRILPHGTKVSKGQNLVWFETEEIDKKIKDAEIDLRLAKLTQDDAEFSYKQFLETQTLDRAAAERARKHAQQDFDNFVQVDRERQKDTAKFNVKSALASLENAQEELEQLEQMYKEDDLTEESEEIVLKRAKQSVEFAEFRLEGTKITSDRTVTQTIPRTQASQEDSLARAQLTYQKKINELNSARKKQEIEIARQRDNFKEEEKKVKEMREERKKVVLQSPMDGFFLHGKLNRGKLSDKPSTLEPGSTVTGTQVIGTVISPKRLRVRVDLNEDQISKISVDDQCTITAKSHPEHEFTGTVKSISSVPYAGSKFDCIVALKTGRNAPAIMPTTHCELEFAAPGNGADQDADKDGDKGGDKDAGKGTNSKKQPSDKKSEGRDDDSEAQKKKAKK